MSFSEDIPAIECRRDDALESCSALEGLRGVSTATATTVLAALWPDDHWIMDSRSAPPLAGLLYALDLMADARPRPGQLAEVTAENYADWYRPGVAAVAERLGAAGRDVERACFLLQTPEPNPDRTWDEYAQLLATYAGVDR